jgi:SulP family sulfate permease
MGVLQTRGRRDSRASVLSHPNWSFDRDLDASSIPSQSLVEHANLGSSPGGVEASSYNGASMRTPSRSFYHRSFNTTNGRCTPFHGIIAQIVTGRQKWRRIEAFWLTTHVALDPAHYASDGLREQTAELATYGLSLNKEPSRARTSLPPSLDLFRERRFSSLSQNDIASSSYPPVEEVIEESDADHEEPPLTSSALTEMIRQPASPPLEDHGKPISEIEPFPPLPTIHDEPERDTERTSLLTKRRSKSPRNYGAVEDVESQGGVTSRSSTVLAKGLATVAKCSRTIMNPKSWDRRAMWEQGIVQPASLIPAVLLGLLLNILDALSYGMILFPLGEPLFADLGSDGISMFYVSTIIAQVVFSSGGSIFKGGIGSEMIEVVPFFHQMAFAIMNRIGKDNPQSVIATTILAFSVSSVLTGLVFFLMGVFGLGSLIGFFPRHILIGCIGGVGYFLLQTGVEVSARLPGSLDYNLETLEKLFHADTVALWIIPLSLAIGLLALKRFIRSNFLVGAYFIVVAVMFYIVVLCAGVSMDTLHKKGWAFDAPSSNNPWYHFYSLYGKLRR